MLILQLLTISAAGPSMRKDVSNQIVSITVIPLNAMICVYEEGGHLMLQPKYVGTRRNLWAYLLILIGRRHQERTVEWCYQERTD